MTLVPAHFTLDLSAAVPAHDEGMSEMWERLHQALDTIPGVFSEGGGSSLMEPGDLISGSPLDRFIKETNDAR